MAYQSLIACQSLTASAIALGALLTSSLITPAAAENHAQYIVLNAGSLFQQASAAPMLRRFIVLVQR